MNRSQTANAFFGTMADCLVAISSPVTGLGVYGDSRADVD
jgi:hypothetical protein